MTELPENFSVTGDCHIWYCDEETIYLTKLPKGFKVGGNLRLTKNLYGSLPEGFFVGGDFDLSEQPTIKSLPKSFNVGGKLTVGTQWDIIKEFLTGQRFIDGIVEMKFDDYRMGRTMSFHVGDDVQARLYREGDMVYLKPAPKEAPKNQDGGELSAAPVKSKVLTEA
jgi:hypothetical protein